MRILFVSLLSLFVLSPGFVLAAQDEIPASPFNRPPPDYPAACEPLAGETVEPQQVTVVFDVSRDGYTQNVRVRETTDDCFNDAAIAAARRWEYEPRRVGRTRKPQEDLEVTLVFLFDNETTAIDFDARPLLRMPPKYPYVCQDRARGTETVLLQFDVAAEGTTENIQVVDSTNRCLNRSAIKAVEHWKYRPKLVDGKPVARPNVQTQIVFKLEGTGDKLSPDEKVRREFRSRLLRVQRKLKKGEDVETILLELEKIEEELGGEFSMQEAVAFYYMRGTARVSAKDYEGALDDLRFVMKSGRAGDSTEPLHRVIEQLEAAVAARAAERAAEKQPAAEEAGTEATQPAPASEDASPAAEE